MTKSICLVTACLAVCATTHASVTYYDTVGDTFGGVDNLDITSVDVSHDADNVYFTINTASGFSFPNDWGNYMIAIDAYDGGSGSNPWGRSIDFGGTEIDRFAGAWVNDGGGALGYHHFDGWYGENDGVSSYYSESGFVSFTFSREWLGSDVTSFAFDAITTGGGNTDPGVDHLSRSDQAVGDWGGTSVAGELLVYNLPAPGALALLALAGCARGRRRRR
jgi:hypothetical protein